MTGRVVFDQALSAVEAGEVEFPGAGAGSYVVAVSVASGGPVSFRVFCGRGLGPGWADVTPLSNPLAGLAADDSASATVTAGPWPSFKLTWDAAFQGSVTVTSGR